MADRSTGQDDSRNADELSSSLLLGRLRGLFLGLVGLVLVVEVVEWLDADSPLLPNRTSAAVAMASAVVWAVLLRRRGRPSLVSDTSLVAAVVVTGWGLGRSGAVLALLLGVMFMRAVYGQRRDLAGATAAVLGGYVMVAWLTSGLGGVLDLGIVTVSVGLASFVVVIRQVGEVSARHDLAAAWDRALAVTTAELLAASSVERIEEVVADGLAALAAGRAAAGGMFEVPEVPTVVDRQPPPDVPHGDAEARVELERRVERLAATAGLARARVRSDQQFRALAERSRDGIYLRSLDHSDQITYANEATRLLVPQLVHTMGPPYRASMALVDVGDQASLSDELRDVGYVRGPIRFRVENGDDEPRWIEIEEVPFAGDDSHESFVQGTIRDVTRQWREEEALRAALERQEEATEQLRQLDELRATFLAAVSHELRTPMAALLGSAQTLAAHRDQLSPEQSSMLAEAVQRQAGRLRRLLDDLLDVERLSRGLITAERSPTPIMALVESVVGASGFDRGRVEIHGDEDLVVDVDFVQVERIVDNLLRNAMKHTPPGTPVRVEVAADGDGARLVVEDEGGGVAPELRRGLFEPFVQGEGAGRAASPGTGIGLSLVKQFTELHGGRVWVDESESGGARFVVVLPGADGDVVDVEDGSDTDDVTVGSQAT